MQLQHISMAQITHIAATQDSPNDAWSDALVNALKQLASNPDPNEPFIAKMAGDFLAYLQNQKTPLDPADVDNALNAFLTQNFAASGEPYCDFVMYYDVNSQGGMDDFIWNINNAASQFDPQFAPIATSAPWPGTAADAVYITVKYYESTLSPSQQQLCQIFLDMIRKTLGSNGNLATFQQNLDQYFTNPSLFLDYPQLNPSTNPNVVQDLLTVVAYIQPTVNFFGQYFTKFPNASSLQLYLNTGFAVVAKMNSFPSGSPAANMWQSLLQNLAVLYNGGTMDQLKTTYNGIFNVTDPFMLFYKVDNTDIYQFVSFIYGQPLVGMLTTADLRYRAAMTYRDTLKPGPDYDLLTKLGQEMLIAGSNPSSTAQQALDSWAMGQVMDPNSDYYKASAQTQQAFLNSVDYSVSLTFLQIYLQNWAGAHPASYNQQFASTLQMIIQGYDQSQMDPSKLSKSDFQNYLDEFYGDTDFCFQIPGLSPTDVDNIYSAFGLQDPYQYGPVDTAYASANQTYQTLYPDPNNPPKQGSPDDVVFNGDGSAQNPGLLEELVDCQNGDISMGDVKAWVKKLILWLQENKYGDQTYWSQVSPSAQQMLENIENM